MRSLAALIACAVLLGGCVAGPAAGPDALELANMRPWNVVPATSPGRLVSSFEAVCLTGPTDPDQAGASLRAQGYVETRRRAGAATRGFVVDDSRPAVLLGQDGRSCAVAARARTGQTAAIHSMIARRYPRAVAIAPARIGPRTESAWDIGGSSVVLNRIVLPGRPSELMLMRLRSAPD